MLYSVSTYQLPLTAVNTPQSLRPLARALRPMRLSCTPIH